MGLQSWASMHQAGRGLAFRLFATRVAIGSIAGSLKWATCVGFSGSDIPPLRGYLPGGGVIELFLPLSAGSSFGTNQPIHLQDLSFTPIP
jgi:hypothetical protein